MLCGGDSMLDLERLRADAAGAELRAVAEVPAASTACQLARRYRRLHLRAAEQAFAACSNGMDDQLGRPVDGAVTLDFDSTGVEVYGPNKPGAGVNDQGQLADQPLFMGAARAAVGDRAVGRQRLHARRGAPRAAGARARLPARRPRPGPRALRFGLLSRRPAHC